MIFLVFSQNVPPGNKYDTVLLTSLQLQLLALEQRVRDNEKHVGTHKFLHEIWKASRLQTVWRLIPSINHPMLRIHRGKSVKCWISQTVK